MLMTFESGSLEETVRFGRVLAECLAKGDVVALIGNLGAGKTHLVQAIAEGLGVSAEDVHSPTFVLIQEYDARVPICHIDAYRLNDIDEFLELGADELVGGDCVALIEWADRVAEVLPRDRLTIELTATGENARRIDISCSGPRSNAIIEALASRLDRSCFATESQRHGEEETTKKTNDTK